MRLTSSNGCRFFLLSLCLSLFLSPVQSLYAAGFKVGETVFVAYPAGNIKEDAFIIGQVTRIDEKGDYQISVLDYVKGHDYGLSCVPMVKQQPGAGFQSESNSIYGSAWSLWKDKTVLEAEKLDYLVSKEAVMKLSQGKQLFIERNNFYIVFGRWKSDAPMLTVDRIERAEREALDANLEEILPALALMKLHRVSYYDDYGRPYRSFESIKPMSQLLSAVLKLFKEDSALKERWSAKERDWKSLSEETQIYFLVEAIDKVVSDAKVLLYEEGLESAKADDLQEMKARLTLLVRDK